jgi:hydroxypyruvate isomerase
MLWALGRTMPLEAMFKIVSAAGYQGVELTNEIADWTLADAENARKLAASMNLVVDAIDGGRYKLADPATATSMLDLFTRRIQLAKQLECPQIILTPGAVMDGVSRETNLQILLEPIDLIESKGTCAVYSVADAFSIVRTLENPNVRVLYDFYHEQRSSGNLLEKLANNIDLIGLVHIADVPGRHEPGTGEIDYANIYRRLAELHYDRFLAMEFYPTGDPAATLRAARLAAVAALGPR